MTSSDGRSACLTTRTSPVLDAITVPRPCVLEDASSEMELDRAGVLVQGSVSLYEFARELSAFVFERRDNLKSISVGSVQTKFDQHDHINDMKV